MLEELDISARQCVLLKSTVCVVHGSSAFPYEHFDIDSKLFRK